MTLPVGGRMTKRQQIVNTTPKTKTTKEKTNMRSGKRTHIITQKKVKELTNTKNIFKKAK